MSRKIIPVEEAFAEWHKDPEYVKAYDALKDEFSLAVAMIEARARAGLTKTRRMGIVLALFVLLFLSGEARSEPIRLLGAGTNASCGSWLENRASNNYYSMGNWALGYLSGAGTYSRDLNSLRSVDSDAVFYWLDNYCHARLTARFVDAVNAFISEHPK